MDYPTLLLQLENQLQSLHKKGLNYINIEAMPKVKLKLLLDGLEEMMCTKTEITVKLEGANYKLSAQNQPVLKLMMKKLILRYIHLQQVFQLSSKVIQQ